MPLFRRAQPQSLAGTLERFVEAKVVPDRVQKWRAGCLASFAPRLRDELGWPADVLAREVAETYKHPVALHRAGDSPWQEPLLQLNELLDAHLSERETLAAVDAECAAAVDAVLVERVEVQRFKHLVGLMEAGREHAPEFERVARAGSLEELREIIRSVGTEAPDRRGAGVARLLRRPAPPTSN